MENLAVTSNRSWVTHAIVVDVVVTMLAACGG